MRCGVTGLRPTFGRVARTGAMTLCWSLDKLGPMTRGVEDALLVLQAITGPDAGDPSSLPSRLDYDGSAPVAGLKVGYFPKWMAEPPATDVDRAALETLRKLGLKPVEVSLPDWPYSSLMPVLFAEAAASFEELTLATGTTSSRCRCPTAGRTSSGCRGSSRRWTSCRRTGCGTGLRGRWRGCLGEVDLLLVPSLRDEMLTISNFTGHPSLTLRTGFVEVTQARSDWAPDPAHPLPTFSPARRVPHGVTLIGRLFDDGTIGRVGVALERAAGVAHEKPPVF